MVVLQWLYYSNFQVRPAAYVAGKGPIVTRRIVAKRTYLTLNRQSVALPSHPTACLLLFLFSLKVGKHLAPGGALIRRLATHQNFESIGRNWMLRSLHIFVCKRRKGD
jgi:hypothetical protein